MVGALHPWGKVHPKRGVDPLVHPLGQVGLAWGAYVPSGEVEALPFWGPSFVGGPLPCDWGPHDQVLGALGVWHLEDQVEMSVR